MTNSKPKLRLDERLTRECPPFLAYYSAAIRSKWRRRWVGVDEICRRSGLPRRTVIRVGAKVTWTGVKVEVMGRFMAACGFRVRAGRVLNIGKITQHLSQQTSPNASRPFNHLNSVQYAHFNRLCERWMDEVGR